MDHVLARSGCRRRDGHGLVLPRLKIAVTLLAHENQRARVAELGDVILVTVVVVVDLVLGELHPHVVVDVADELRCDDDIVAGDVVANLNIDIDGFGRVRSVRRRHDAATMGGVPHGGSKGA